MSIKTILAPVTGTPSDRLVLNAAVALAGEPGAHIQVLFLHRDPQDIIVPHLGHNMNAGLIESLIRSADEQIKTARHAANETYDAWRSDCDVGEQGGAVPASGITAGYAESIGDMATRMTNAGRLADVICMVRTPSEDTGYGEEALIEAALLETGKPLVLVPGDSALETIKSIAIAWNGSRESARTVSLAMPLLEMAENVSVLAGTGDGMNDDDVRAFVKSLAWHGIDATPTVFALNGANLTERLQAEAEKNGAELMVMGAYSHSRFREFVLGGVTDDMINGGRMPVLMAH
jgi:nucleotide-binding universal stress UspA family protein